MFPSNKMNDDIGQDYLLLGFLIPFVQLKIPFFTY